MTRSDPLSRGIERAPIADMLVRADCDRALIAETAARVSVLTNVCVMALLLVTRLSLMVTRAEIKLTLMTQSCQ